ncbi:MAG TPA: permease, partial [Anaerolineae bacterium]
SLIPLYAIGVFLSFTLSQAGMARRWHKSGQLRPDESIKERGSTVVFDKGWHTKMVINGIGSLMSAVVMIVFAVTKFTQGAWVVVLLIPGMAWVFARIHVHYQDLARSLSLEGYSAPATSLRHKVIVPVAGVHRGTLVALRYALLLSDDVTAVHVSMDDAEAERVRKKWELWGEGIRLLILESPYRLMIEPLLLYIEKIMAQRQPNETITIVVPQFVPQHWWQNALHTQTATLLRVALLFRRGIMVTDVPYHVDDLKPLQVSSPGARNGTHN